MKKLLVFIFALALVLSVASLAAASVVPSIITTFLPSGTVGPTYSHPLAASGDTPITWSVEAGSLPDGLSLNASTGVISGTPTTVATSNFTIKATNAAGDNTKGFSIIISTTPAPPAITSLVDGFGKVGVWYERIFGVQGDAPITWNVEAGNLPDGLSLDPSTGIISGTPTTAGTFNFTLKATNNVGTNTKAYSMVVSAITSTNSTSVVYGAGGTFQVTATGIAPITYSLTGAPAGVSINSATGLITIADTTAAGTHTFTITASLTIPPLYETVPDPNVTQSFTLTVGTVTVPPDTDFPTAGRPPSDLPKTGDGFPIGALLALLGISLVALVGLGRRLRSGKSQM